MANQTCLTTIFYPYHTTEDIYRKCLRIELEWLQTLDGCFILLNQSFNSLTTQVQKNYFIMFEFVSPIYVYRTFQSSGDKFNYYIYILSLSQTYPMLSSLR